MENKEKKCGNCQRFTALERCSLLDLVHEKHLLLDYELIKRVKKESLHPETPACEYFDYRVNGHCFSKGINNFIKQNTRNRFVFCCPIERCKKPIFELSSPLTIFKIGFTTFYCPHCNSPMRMDFNDYLKRYEIIYWDSRFDIFQKDFRKLTGRNLEHQKSAENFGISIADGAYYLLDLKNEFILLSGKNISEDSLEEIIYFPLKELNYISCRTWSDYLQLREMLHAEYSDKYSNSRKLYESITLYEPRKGPISIDPTPLEVGGNEIIIATKICNNISLSANIQSREATLEAASSEATNCKELYREAKKNLQLFIGKMNIPKELDFKYWQQIEGGCGSLMYHPFKKEAKMFGFFTPSREKARKVRGEPFLQYMLYSARSDYHSAINGVNQIIGNIIKEVAYNAQGVAFDGLRGWCHRDYLKGLFYDEFEIAKFVTLLGVNRAIREERLKPTHFIKKRGKRYDLIYGIEPESSGEEVIR